MARIDREAPRKIGGAAEEFLVEPVSPTPNRLCERKTRNDSIEGCPEVHAPPPRNPEADQDSCSHAAGNSKAALAEGKNLPPWRVAEQLKVCCYVVEASADHTGWHCPEGDCGDVVLVTATS